MNTNMDMMTTNMDMVITNMDMMITNMDMMITNIDMMITSWISNCNNPYKSPTCQVTMPPFSLSPLSMQKP